MKKEVFMKKSTIFIVLTAAVIVITAAGCKGVDVKWDWQLLFESVAAQFIPAVKGGSYAELK